MRSHTIARRDFMKLGLGAFLASQISALYGQETNKPRAKNCILLWMNGGPSHVDTWDLKRNNGPFKPIDTAVKGTQISEHLPLLAKQAEKFALIRSLTSKEADHGRATMLMHTGNIPQETVGFPTLGAVASREWGESRELPLFVSVGEGYTDPGFLGGEHAPFVVDLDNPTEMLQVPDERKTRLSKRLALLDSFNGQFAHRTDAKSVEADEKVMRRALSLMGPKSVDAFDISKEDEKVRAGYGDTPFGKGCLMARRLVEHGVRFVEVGLDGWDTHEKNFEVVKGLSQTVDPAMSTLLQELQDKHLLDETLVIWMGEFGRTPEINDQQGRDHHSRAFSVVLAGGGVTGGRLIGATDDTGTEVKERPVTVPDLYASLFNAFGFDSKKEYMTPEGRPIKLADKGTAMKELFS